MMTSKLLDGTGIGLDHFFAEEEAANAVAQIRRYRRYCSR